MKKKIFKETCKDGFLREFENTPKSFHESVCWYTTAMKGGEEGVEISEKQKKISNMVEGYCGEGGSSLPPPRVTTSQIGMIFL